MKNKHTHNELAFSHSYRILKILDSCVTYQHLDSVMNMVKTHLNRFNNTDIAKVLLKTINDKKKQIECQKN
jgi:hypothetical protein